MPLTESRGKEHDYLGMRFDFSKDGEVSIDMIEYIKSMIAEMPEEMKGKAATPAADHLFKVSDEPVPIEADKADVFHRIVMQLQYLSQRGRPDVRTAVSFLCKRTNCPDQDDWRKLTRVMRYLQSTLDLKLRLSADGKGIIEWWVDASFAVHGDMKSHTGATMSLGKGSVYSTSSAQKLTTRSSTESEVVGVHDVLPQVLWSSNFLKAQVFEVKESMVYQDNMSSMRLETNGRASSGKRTRHMELRFFFAKDCVDRKLIRIAYCPTKQMLADFFTKPLQGESFYMLRSQIMNIDPSSEYYMCHRSVLDPAVRTYADVARNGIAERK